MVEEEDPLHHLQLVSLTPKIKSMTEEEKDHLHHLDPMAGERQAEEVVMAEAEAEGVATRPRPEEEAAAEEGALPHHHRPHLLSLRHLTTMASSIRPPPRLS